MDPHTDFADIEVRVFGNRGPAAHRYSHIMFMRTSRHVQATGLGFPGLVCVSPCHVKPTISISRPVGAEETKAMSPTGATLCRRVAARINYVALDRPDLNVASSHMSNPKEGDYQVVERIIRYLK